LRRCGLALYFATLVAWSAVYGVPVQRELVVALICGALVIASLGRSPRRILHLVVAWLPMLAVLAVYDLSRGAAGSLGIRVHVHRRIDFVRVLFFGETEGECVEAGLSSPGVVQGWDIAFALVYTSYFSDLFAAAGVVWARDRLAFVRFARRLVTL